MKIEFSNNGKNSTLIIMNPACFLKRHAKIALAAAGTAPNARINTTGILVLRTILTGETYEIWKAAITARQIAETYYRISFKK